MKIAKYILIVASGMVLAFTASGQNTTGPIRHIVTATEQKLEFVSPENTIVKTIDITKHNPYAKLRYKAARSSGSVTSFALTEAEKRGVISDFFLKPPDPQIVPHLKPSGLKALTDVAISGDYVIVSDHLNLYGNGGVLGIKSTAVIYDKTGKQIAKLPENNDGYIAPVVDDKARFLATLFGDESPDVDMTLLPLTGFRLYDVKSGRIVYELRTEGSDFDCLPPTFKGGSIVHVLRRPESQYEYLIFRPETRTLFRKVFSIDEVDMFVQFTDEGIMVYENGNTRLREFNTEFSKSSF